MHYGPQKKKRSLGWTQSRAFFWVGSYFWLTRDTGNVSSRFSSCIYWWLYLLMCLRQRSSRGRRNRGNFVGSRLAALHPPSGQTSVFTHSPERLWWTSSSLCGWIVRPPPPATHTHTSSTLTHTLTHPLLFFLKSSNVSPAESYCLQAKGPPLLHFFFPLTLHSLSFSCPSPRAEENEWPLFRSSLCTSGFSPLSSLFFVSGYGIRRRAAGLIESRWMGVTFEAGVQWQGLCSATTAATNTSARREGPRALLQKMLQPLTEHNKRPLGVY